MKKIIVAVAALALMASSAYAAEWNFYGKAMVYTFWENVDTVDDKNDSGVYYDTQFKEGIYTDSKIGANVKVSDELSARFEYQLSGGNVRLEHLYGAWDFGSGILTIGQTDTPINVSYSSQMWVDVTGEDNALYGFGDFDNGQHAEIMLTFGGFSIAIINPEKDAWVGAGNNINSYVMTSGNTSNTQVVIPMIAACYKATFDMGEAQIAAGYNTFEVNDGEDEDIDAYAIGLGTHLNFGAMGMFATFVWGQNIANLGAGTYSAYNGTGVYDSVNSDVYDCESIGGTIGMTFAVNDMLALEVGYGYIHDELDTPGDNLTNMAQSYYLQAPITLAPGVTVTPEVGMVDMRDGNEEETVYVGAAWAITF